MPDNKFEEDLVIEAVRNELGCVPTFGMRTKEQNAVISAAQQMLAIVKQRGLLRSPGEPTIKTVRARLEDASLRLGIGVLAYKAYRHAMEMLEPEDPVRLFVYDPPTTRALPPEMHYRLATPDEIAKATRR